MGILRAKGKGESMALLSVDRLRIFVLREDCVTEAEPGEKDPCSLTDVYSFRMETIPAEH